MARTTLGLVPFRPFADLRGSPAPLRWPELYSGTTGFRKTDGDGLLRRTRAVFAFSDVVHLLAHELAGLRRARFPLFLVPFGAFQRFLLRHVASSWSVLTRT